MDHWKLTGDVPPAATVSVALCPALMVVPTGCVVIDGGVQVCPGVTVTAVLNPELPQVLSARAKYVVCTDGFTVMVLPPPWNDPLGGVPRNQLMDEIVPPDAVVESWNPPAIGLTVGAATVTEGQVVGGCTVTTFESPVLPQLFVARAKYDVAVVGVGTVIEVPVPAWAPTL